MFLKFVLNKTERRQLRSTGMIRKVLGRKILQACKSWGIPEDFVKAWSQKEFTKQMKRKRRYLVPWRSFYFGNRVIVTVRPHRKFRWRDQLIHHHFNWATILWHKFNGLNLQIKEYLQSVKKKQELERRKKKRRVRKAAQKKKISSPKKIIDTPELANVSDDEVQVIETHTLIDLASDDEEPSVPETTFPKIVSVKSAGTIVEKISNVFTLADECQFILPDDEPSESSFYQNNPEVEEDLKPTNEELERARLLFSALDDDVHPSDESGNKSTSSSFLDSLADKMGVEIPERNHLRARKSFEDCYSELETTFRQVNEISSKFRDLPIKDEESCSSTEFYGFNENDTTPGLLPTPLVRKAGSNSAFISENCDDLLRKIGSIPVDSRPVVARKKTKKRYNRHRSSDDGRINQDSKPPKLECPDLPQDLKPRTLAEKKQLLKVKPIGYQVMDQENSVYHLWKKRSRDPPDTSEAFYEQVNRILMQPVPMRRNVWKSATWLNTRHNHYIFRYVEHDDREVKLIGSLGNFPTKIVYKIPQIQTPLSNRKTSLRCCLPKAGFPRNVKFTNVLEILQSMAKEAAVKENLVLKEAYNKSQNLSSPLKRKWNLKQTRKIRPGPLSKKAQIAGKSENVAPLETFTLPEAFLRVWPRVNVTFPLEIKRYLTDLCCPYENLTQNWIKFALSTLQLDDEATMENPEGIEFEIPYENNRRKILVSRSFLARKKKEKSREIFSAETPLTFREDLPEDDLLGQECADILENMIDSVAIGMSEDNFSKDDPDLDYDQQDTRKRVTSATSDECPRFKKPRHNAPLLNELKRLNATIINTESIQRKITPKECKLQQCMLGCICDSISALSYPIRHCERVQCMFECQCDRGLVFNSSTGNTFSKEVFRIRDKAISGLARAEKEFSSTVVLTNNNTFLLSNSDESNKRNRMAPRRYGDYVNPEVGSDDQGDEGRSIRKSHKIHPELERMRHVSVQLIRMDDILKPLEPWCLIHELYRCFCKGESKIGKPFSLTKVTNNIAMSGEGGSSSSVSSSIYMSPPKRPRVFYDPDALIRQNQDYEPPAAVTIPPSNFMRFAPRLYKRSDFVFNTVKHSVTRCLPFDAKFQIERNRRMAHNVKKYIAANETSKNILQLLKKRVNESSRKTKQALEQELKDQRRKNGPMFEETPPQSQPLPVEFVEATPEESSILKAQAPPASSPAPLPVISSVKSGQEAEAISSTTNENSMSSSFSDKENEEIRERLTKTINMHVSQMIKTIMNNEEKTTLGTPQINRITTIKWTNLLNEYRNCRLHIWEVHYPGRKVVVITRDPIRPLMPPGYNEVLEIRTLKGLQRSCRNPSTVICNMLCYSYDLPQIEEVAAFLLGHKDYWQVIGYIRRDNVMHKSLPKYFSVSRDTHPEVADKVNALFNALYKRVKATSSRVTSNVKMMTKDQIKDAQFLKFPLPNQPGQRWFMLMITNDFSDIHHPQWGQMLSYDRISYAIMMAQKKERTIQVKSNNSMSLNPSVYVAPYQSDKIFIGPYNMEEDESDIVLYQRLDGKLLLREEYEKKTNIRRERSTMGCWIQMKAVTVSKEITQPIMLSDVENEKETPPPPPVVKTSQKTLANPEKSREDDDCFFLEADPKEIKAAEEAKEAEVAVNTILPDGLKLPVESPKKLVPKQADSQTAATTEPGRIRVIPEHVLAGRRQSESPGLEGGDSSKTGVVNPLKRKSDQIIEASKAKLLPKDLTILPCDENDLDQKKPWNISPPAAKVSVLPIDSEPESTPPISTLPVISKVESLSQNQQEEPKKTVVSQVPELNNRVTMPTLVTSASVVNSKYPRQLIYVMNPPAVSGVQQIQMKLPMDAAKTLDSVVSNSNSIIKIIQPTPSLQTPIVLPSLPPLATTASSGKSTSEPIRIVTGVQQITGKMSGVTASGKRIILHPISSKSVVHGPTGVKVPVAQKRMSPPPLVATQLKRIRVEEVEKINRSLLPKPQFKEIGTKPTPGPTSEPGNTIKTPTIVSQIGQTIIKTPQLPVVASLAQNHQTVTVTSSKSVDGIIRNGVGGQTMKVKINLPQSGASSSSVPTRVILPKNTTLKNITTRIITGTSQTPGNLMTTAKTPLKVAITEGKKVVVTRTSPDGKAVKYFLNTSKVVTPTNLKLVQTPSIPQTITKVVTAGTSSVASTTLVQSGKPVCIPSVKEVKVATSTSTTAPAAAAAEGPKGQEKKSCDDVIELSDDDDESNNVNQQNLIEKVIKKVYVDSTAKEIRENSCRGYISSNIKQLGLIPARKTSTDLYLTLPIYSHHVKVGIQCLNRYMGRYMRNCVAIFLPTDLEITWEFHENDSQNLPGEKFNLQATNRDRMVLTQYGAIAMDEDISETLVTEPSIYFQLLMIKLGFVCESGDKKMRSMEVLETAIKTIKALEEISREMNKTEKAVKDIRRKLNDRLQELKASPQPSPPTSTA